jgi:hypothetical protein
MSQTNNNVKRKHNWEKLGLLDITPIERKEYVASVLDKALTFAIKNEDFPVNFDDNDEGIINLIFFPIILGIVNKININDNQIKDIYFEIMNKYNDEYKNNLSNNFLMDDNDAKICNSFFENKIEELTKKINN